MNRRPKFEAPMFRIPERLPCFPCPHRSVCCRFGTYLGNIEGRHLLNEFGPEYVYFSEDDQELKTQVKNGRCAFYSPDDGCTIHDHPHYPASCRDYPAKDAKDHSLPHALDAIICPEIK